MKVKLYMGNSPYFSIQPTGKDAAYYYPACVIPNPPVEAHYVVVNNAYELEKLFFDGALELPPQQKPIQYPVSININQPKIACYPSVNSYEEVTPLLSSGFFKPLSTEQRTALREHNIKNYKPSTNATKHIRRDIPSVDALEVMTNEIEEMTEKGIAFKA